MLHYATYLAISLTNNNGYIKGNMENLFKGENKTGEFWETFVIIQASSDEGPHQDSNHSTEVNGSIVDFLKLVPI